MAITKQDLIHIRELIAYWTIRQTEAERMVKGLLYEEKVIKDRISEGE